jgi:hypothetical protein
MQTTQCVRNKVRPDTEELNMAARECPWSAVLREATLVSGPLDKMALCDVNRTWSKDLFLRVRFGRPLPAAVIEAIPDPSGKKMQPLLVVSSTRFAGIHRCIHAEADGMGVLCFVPPYEGSAFKSSDWIVRTPGKAGVNLCSTPVSSLYPPAVPEDLQDGVTVHRSPQPISPSTTEVQESFVSIAPPLHFHVRMNMFHLDEINTVAQTFRADVYVEFRLRSITSEPDEHLVNELLRCYGFRENMLELMMTVEKLEEERWSALTSSSTRPGTYDYTLKLRTKAVFAEQYELESFPFDEQDLHVCVTLNIPVLRAVLVENLEFPSVMMHRTFQQKTVFNIVNDEVLDMMISKSDPSESGAGFVYPRATFSTTLSRQGGYYVTNVVMPMTVLTYLAGISAGAVDADGQRLSTADRLSVTLTLLLTAVAYKFIVATSLPQVSYLTSLDTYVLVCFLFMLIIVIENVVWPAVVASNDEEEPFSEVYILIAYLTVVTLFNLYYGVREWWKLWVRTNKRRIKRAEFEFLRDTVQGYEEGRHKLLDLRRQCDELREDIEKRKGSVAAAAGKQTGNHRKKLLSAGSIDKDLEFLLTERTNEVAELQRQQRHALK